MEIFYSSHFKRAFEKLPVILKKEAQKHELVFRKNPFDPSLKTHKLKGKSREFWSFSVTYKHRIVFRFLNEEAVLFIDVGEHSIYQ